MKILLALIPTMWNHQAMKTNELESLQEEISRKYGTKLVCELPDFEFDCGGLVWNLTTKTGHHSGRATIGGLGLWNICARNLLRNVV